ncbi:chemotaxis protein CheR [Ureibacillus massiliensis 4400831 = CIP 108448 = CCUG 49529]|uniref:Chemotaxis protein CheR n=1 Tax=Ureibacillus massiliensis 4400831 = CIP 108448 = CCUG 49529 TaxID=1211035 RepID=A0A0A3IZG4_9BACL|nr:protein-glutamate O-methyltransferase CheR [Ureibacillus massiliensis]KGR90116.1 chemotaxis protein CheR [Ureibacillus massiliensis 4400831 = CIP 108448 = CCUG 49529]BDH61699.1 chemotaxis protein R [Lysinibacillus sp. PLM2]
MIFNEFLSHHKPHEELEELEIKLLLNGVYEWCGYDFRDYAYPSLRRRILHRVYSEKLSTITELLNKLLHDNACLHRLIDDLSINVTEMFRDPSFWKEFRENVIPFLQTFPSIRIWHAGCATGEEVYSMAILLKEEGLYEKTKIYATDINQEVLQTAKRGYYPLEHMKKYTQNYLQSGGNRAFSDYYKVTDTGVKFNSNLMKNVVFAQHNLVSDRSFNEFQVILCRNVMIYFNKTLQKNVHQLFYESLSKFGFLGLGDKETMHFTDFDKYYEQVSTKQKLYQKTT